MATYEEGSLGIDKLTTELENSLSYMKLGFIGPKTLEQVGNNPMDALPLFKGFFIIGNFGTIRADLHKIVDDACDALEKARREHGEGN